MKRIKLLSLVLALTLALSLVFVSCGDDKPAESKPEASTPPITEPSSVAEPSSEAEPSVAEPSSEAEPSVAEPSSEPVEESSVEPEYEPDAYLWVSSTADGKFPNISWAFDTSEFDKDAVYTFYAIAKYEAGSTGNIYVNAYSYSNYEAAKGNNWEHLLGFYDFASFSRNGLIGVWETYEYGWNISEKQYGGHTGPGDRTMGVTMGIGFWEAAGTICVAELGVKDADGNILWSRNFADGFDISDPELTAQDFAGVEGEDYGMVGAEFIDSSIIDA